MKKKKGNVLALTIVITLMLTITAAGMFLIVYTLSGSISGREDALRSDVYVDSARLNSEEVSE